MQVIPAHLRGFDTDSLPMDGTAKGLTSEKAVKAKAILVQFQGADGYFKMDGTNPTAVAGGGLFLGNGDTPMFFDRFNFSKLKFIAASGYLFVQYLA